MGEGDPVGGSRALAGVLDEYCEDVWLDLREFHQGFDLVEWLDPAKSSPSATPSMVVAMINDLPRWSRFKARTYGKGPRPLELTEAEKKQVDWFAERRMWNPDREMLAGISNSLQELLIHLPRWTKPPKLNPIGPPEWRKITPWDKPPEATVNDVYAAFGFSGVMAAESPASARSGPSVDDIYRHFGGTP